MKTWISFLLPEDEYKEKKVLHFISEGAIILFVYLIAMLFLNRYFNFTIEVVLLTSIAIFLFYVYGRYIISGIEYTEVSTKKSYRKELKVILVRISTFIGLFLLASLVFTGVPGNRNEWIDGAGLLLGISIVMFSSNFISLRSSYKKNKELL
ncbi:DUF3278 domain-containing protein [Saliterribacillus persicus]|uniref:DUF3278 domain-containing protein n=1 Tax=Saliterribacillus persicus TaxID=930114 RepID=A0A368YB06_9BACI|nr:DUF3278 domain-containing protein [Saliterribacillus persicus]RCW76879.1 hypothetical protein DFR57_102154 [Saliterribacillus persicus]